MIHIAATICAEIRMERVKEVRQNDRRDAFCVKDPKQILRWVMIVDKKYDENTRCGCI